MRKKNPRFRIGLVVTGSCLMFVGRSAFIVGSSLGNDLAIYDIMFTESVKGIPVGTVTDIRFEKGNTRVEISIDPKKAVIQDVTRARMDRLLVAERVGQLRAYEFHRWMNPLNRLVQAAVRRGVQETGAFAEAKGLADPSGEDFVLRGRILDFHQSAVEGRWVGLVRIGLRLARAADRAVVLQRVFSATTSLAEAEEGETFDLPAELAIALSAGTGPVIELFHQACAEAGLFADLARPGK